MSGESDLGTRLTERRGRRSQAWLAAQVGVTQAAVSYWESGKRVPELRMIARLAAALGCDPGWLAFGTAPAPAEEASA